MTDVFLGPFCVLTSAGGPRDLAAGRFAPDAWANLDAMLPKPSSLRRASHDSKGAVVVAARVLREAAPSAPGRVGVYVAQQHGSTEYSSEFVAASWREGPRMASPMLFSESVANNAATHLSLTLGLNGIVATFIGTRAAAMQAVIAAREDLASDVTDAGLVVVLGSSSRVLGDAYRAIYRARARRLPELRFLTGAAAFLVRRSLPSPARLAHVGLRCHGNDRTAALRGLAEEGHVAGARVLASTFLFSREPDREAIRTAVGDVMDPPLCDESFALDPVLQLVLDSLACRDAVPRTVVCLGEEGIAGLLAVEGPVSSIEVA